ncbi:MAG: hypothetical protein HQL61_18105, partial [Magnetococcales bacterium]|nr:hypothetical protein [Nitrospirota bacterium]
MEGGYGLRKIKEIGQSVLNKEGRELFGLPDPSDSDFKSGTTTQPKKPEGVPTIMGGSPTPDIIKVLKPGTFTGDIPDVNPDPAKKWTDQKKPPGIQPKESTAGTVAPVTTLPKGAGSYNSPTYGKVSYTSEEFGLPGLSGGGSLGGLGNFAVPTPSTTSQPNRASEVLSKPVEMPEYGTMSVSGDAHPGGWLVEAMHNRAQMYNLKNYNKGVSEMRKYLMDLQGKQADQANADHLLQLNQLNADR